MSADLTPEEITRRLAHIGFVDNAEPLSADHDRYSWCIPGNEPGVIDMLPGGVFELYGSAEVIARIVSALGILRRRGKAE